MRSMEELLSAMNDYKGSIIAYQKVIRTKPK